MYRRRREKRRRLIQNVIWWHPILLMLLMFALGACTKSAGRDYTMPSTGGLILDTAEAARDAEPSAEPGETVISIQSSAVETLSFAEEISSEAESGAGAEHETTPAGLTVSETGNYTSKDEVALYIHLYGKLPSNYITKQNAERQGWDSHSGNLDDVLPGMSIGGSFFGNYEGLLPSQKGRKYYECDIDYEGGYRNAKRIIYSNDGLIFYTEDHYNSFEQLY